MDNYLQYTQNLNKNNDEGHLSYTDFRNQKECMHCAPNKIGNSFSYDLQKGKECTHCMPGKCNDSLMDNQKKMNKCEAQLFCEATSRLCFELCVAKDLCEIQQIIETISCLFSASALKQESLAKVIKSFNNPCLDICECDYNCYDCNCDCDCDCCCE